MKSVSELLRDASLLHRQRRLDEAAQIYRQLLRIKPNSADVIGLLGKLRLDQGRVDEAIVQFEKASAIDPSDASAHYHRGFALMSLGRYAAAADAFRLAYERKSYAALALPKFAYMSRTICDWTSYARQESELTAAVRAGATTVDPFTFLQFSDDPADLLACARAYVAGRRTTRGPIAQFAHDPGRKPEQKIRIGYLSADFRYHATTLLLTELIELHDRSRFEVIGISIGPDDESPARKRIAAAFDRFIDARDWMLEEIGQKIYAFKLDILIDLMGFTTANQVDVVASRPAPIQVNFLGYPGTIGAEFMDYVVVDPIVVPPDHAPYFSEKLVHLPDCYQVNDRRRPSPKRPPTRTECGLPENSFVFCCFNGSLKITPRVFDVWMRLLAAVPDSVLWLLESNKDCAPNLRREAAERSIDPTRVLFAPRVPHADHLARQSLADVFLDTYPYTAHTTASEALWVGLPIVTCMGRSFAARVCGSVLHAIGVPELITHSLEEYETLALALSADQQRLAQLRARIIQNRDRAPLFDTPRYCRHIEAAFQTMVNIWRRGDKPRAFAIEPIAA